MVRDVRGGRGSTEMCLQLNLNRGNQIECSEGQQQAMQEVGVAVDREGGGSGGDGRRR